MKIWTLSSFVYEDRVPIVTEVFTSHEAALKALRGYIEPLWYEEDKDGKEIPFPDDVMAAHQRMCDYDDFDPWRIDEHELPLPTTTPLQFAPWQNGDGGPQLPTWKARLDLSSNAQGHIDRIDLHATHPTAGDERSIWIECDANNLVIHAYDSQHDEPQNVRIGFNAITIDSDREEV